MLTATFFSLLCAFYFGYSAQRGALCVVSGIVEMMELRTARVFLSFFRCSFWVLLVTLPLYWLYPAVHPAPVFSVGIVTIMGGFLFGAGAAINGGCSFGTLARLATGELSFMASFLGFALGVWGQSKLSVFLTAPTSAGISVLTSPSRLGAILLGLTAIFCVREIILLPHRRRSKSWPPELAALVLGISAGVLYILNGAWFYTWGITRVFSGFGLDRERYIWIFTIASVTLAGALICSVGDRTFCIRFPWRLVPLRIIGGGAMGFGGALIPGGNGTLILQAFPALSPNAPFAYTALILGSASVLSMSRFFRQLARFPGVRGRRDVHS